MTRSLGFAALALLVGCSGDDFSGQGGSAGTAGSAGASGGGGASSGGTSATGGEGGAAGGTGGGTSGGGTGGAVGGTGGGTSGGGAGGAVGGTGGGTSGGGTDGGALGGSGGVVGLGGAGGQPGCAPLVAVQPLVYSTLDDQSAIEQPAQGAPGYFAGGSFSTGMCGDAFDVTDAGQGAKFTVSEAIYSSGTVDFLFKPNGHCLSPGQTVIRTLFHRPHGPTPPGLSVSLHISTTETSLQAHYAPDSSPITVSTPFTCVPTLWTRITLTWSSNTGLRLYTDGQLRANVGLPSVTVDGNATTNVYVGASGGGYTNPANGLIDEFRLYGEVVYP